MSSLEEIIDKAKEYLSWDPCEETRNQITTLIENNDGPALQSLIGQRQLFGTAGLRGPMCAGYAGLNYLVVLQTTQVKHVQNDGNIVNRGTKVCHDICQGLLKYLQKQLGAEVAAMQGVVIGYDHRRLGAMNSKAFAELCARVFAAHNFKVYLYESLVATPLVPYGVNKLNAAGTTICTVVSWHCFLLLPLPFRLFIYHSWNYDHGQSQSQTRQWIQAVLGKWGPDYSSSRRWHIREHS